VDARDAATRHNGMTSMPSRDEAPSRVEGSAERPPPAAVRRTGLPAATVARLPVYLRVLTGLAETGLAATVSSDRLAAAAGVGPAKLRKDLSYLGSYGTRGVGYDVEFLVYQISRALGLTQHYSVVIIGVGNLGHALAGYAGFATRGFRIAALLDADRSRVGETLSGLRVRHVSDLEAVCAEHDVSIGVIAVPGPAAQDVCDRLVRSGVTSILNFAPVVLSVPDSVEVRKVDLSIELQILAFHEQRKTLAAPPVTEASA
jgi:redox-sensing transcriptional repressor